MACKAVLSAITQMKFAANDADNFAPPLQYEEPSNFLDAVDRDPIASLRSAIRNVCILQIFGIIDSA